MDHKGFIVLALTAVLTLVTGAGDESSKGSCPPNMHYTECGSGCPKTCTDGTGPDHSPRICTLSCESGCVCDEGYVYESLASKRCIPSSDCKQTCPANSQDVECGTACPLTCDNYRNPPICMMQCVPGCACKTGYILESATSKNCIRPSECKKTCQDHAHYNECGTACPLTCANYKDLVVCTLHCVAGCFCDEGYVLESATSKRCIPRKECEKVCGPNSRYTDCGTACPLTCGNYQNPPLVCTKRCVRGCFCEEGYVRVNAASNVCVKESQCKSCDANSHYSTCATACPLNCQNFRDPPRMCPLICLEGCICNKGYVFQSGQSGPCVPRRDCPGGTED